MPIKLDTNNKPSEAKFHPFKIDEGTDIELQIRPPTFADLTADLERPVGFVHKRIERGVVDWRGVNDKEGNPLPYSLQNFERLCVQHPAILQMVAITLGSYYLTGQRESPVEPTNED